MGSIGHQKEDFGARFDRICQRDVKGILAAGSVATTKIKIYTCLK